MAHETQIAHLASNVATQRQWGIGETVDVACHLVHRVRPGASGDDQWVTRRNEVDLVLPLAAALGEAVLEVADAGGPVALWV
eukprot:2762647-Pyramimonas_sp.AAC.1